MTPLIYGDSKTIASDLVDWYLKNHRQLPWRESKDPFAIWVSEVMLQQTQVKTVVPYYLRFMEKFPTADALCRADLDTVLKFWEGLGYYARARNLHKASCRVANTLDGNLPDSMEGIRELPGVGDYIASAVLSIAFGKPHAVVDGNVKRVLSRLFCLKYPVNLQKSHNAFKAIAQELLWQKDPGTYNQAVMELGALVCAPANPRCEDCPLKKNCQAFEKEAIKKFPVRLPAKKIDRHRIAVGVIRKNGQVLITKRKEEGLLGGLWEFPGGKLEKDETAAQACVREIREETGLVVRVEKHLTRVKHAYTHFKIEMDVFYCRHVSGGVDLKGPVDYKWTDLESMDQFAFPRANLKFIPLIEVED